MPAPPKRSRGLLDDYPAARPYVEPLAQALFGAGPVLNLLGVQPTGPSAWQMVQSHDPQAMQELAAGFAGTVTPAKGLARLVAARRLPDGSVMYGKPGENHGMLLGTGHGKVDYENDMGFALPGGPFMSRKDALRWVDENEPGRAPVARGPASNYRSGVAPRYLEANEYNLPVDDLSGGLLNEPAPAKGIRAFHGSPHDFDKFSLSKIGTGEGAQAYGHGLYFAEREGVAKSYRDALAKADGSAVRPDDVAIAKYGAQWDELVQKIRAADYKDPALRAEQDALHQQMVDDTIARNPHLTKGRMYEVNIKADPESLLDWDAPLSQQPEKVREAVKTLGVDRSAEWYDGLPLPDGGKLRIENGELGPQYFLEKGDSKFRLTEADAARLIGPQGGEPIGSAIYSMLQARHGTPTAASEALRQAGVPGLRYYDGGSRAAGEGTRNIVAFDDSLVEILRKYGLAGLTSAGGLLGAKEYVDRKGLLDG
jgi:hypothetical protein